MNVDQDSFEATAPVLEELTLNVIGVSYLLVDCVWMQRYLSWALLTALTKGIDSFIGPNDTNKQRSLFILYPTGDEYKITKPLLQEFRDNCLEHDDIFQPGFLTHFVFYGAVQR